MKIVKPWIICLINLNYAKKILYLVVIISIISCNSQEISNTTNQSNNVINVEYPEAYELSNIILTLTEYGKNDKWEVRQDFDYYDEVQAYFKPIMNHPLLDSVNYSRKRWEEYLSFRTDAYAFSFNEQDQLVRNSDFYANKGVNPFDKHLDLINDFVKQSNFRSFFQQHRPYYKAIVEKYKKTQYINEMRGFLIQEFGQQVSSDKRYNVVLSPFVYRMNCHRNIDSITVSDFITIPNNVLSDTIVVNQ